METSVNRDLGRCKNILANILVDSEDIKEIMVFGEPYSDEMWYGKDNDENDFGIIYKQIFPHLYASETQTRVKPFIFFETNIYRIPTSAIKDIKITIWCLCHKNCMQFSKKGYLGTRADILADAVERSLNDTYRFGIGKLRLESVTNMSVLDNYYGREMIFTCPDFKEKQIQ